MENVGAITYKDSLLLLNSRNASIGQRQQLLELLAHEMAHLWFGDLVTMQWYDDLWLNEAFATWISYRIAGQVHPDLRFDRMSLRSASIARMNDAQPSVKPIRRQFRGDDNLREAFDILSYNKGQAILGMIEAWIGEANFRAALRRYFVRHHWGNTRAEDLWAAFAEAGDDSLPETVRRYVEQPGIPELRIQRLPGDRLEVRQRRYRSLTAKGVTEQLWQVPIVLRYGTKSDHRTARLLLKQEHDVFSVPGLDQAVWIHPNAGESGHYLWSLPRELTSVLAKPEIARLSLAERGGLFQGADLQSMSGNLGADQLLEFALNFANDPEPDIKNAVAGTVSSLAGIVPTNDRPAYATLIRRTLRPMLDEIGFQARPDEGIERQELRGMLFANLGFEVEDPHVIAFCREAAARQFIDPRGVSAEIASTTLAVANWHGDAAWATQARAAFEKATAPDVRARLAGTLTGFRDPALVRAGLDYALTEAVKPAEFRGLLNPGREETTAVFFDWLVQNYDSVKRKVPEQYLPFLTHILFGGDAELLARGRAFFLDPARKDALTEQHLTQVADLVELMVALRERHGPGLSKFIQARPALNEK